MNTRRILKMLALVLGLALIVSILPSGNITTAQAGMVDQNKVLTLKPYAIAGSSTWFGVWSPFLKDANGNSYTTYEYSTNPDGPWTPACSPGVGGEVEWRMCIFDGLTASMGYYFRVTFFDPDGVLGINPYFIGPIQTRSTANNAVTFLRAAVTSRDTHLLAAALLNDDSNMNSKVSMEVGASPTGPWVQKCGPHWAKLCRIHGLIPNNNYYVRVTVTDPDGVIGSGQQVVGPVKYSGRLNLALGKPVTAVPFGWGCCSDPNQLTDSLIQNLEWPYGFAWCGGTGSYGGCGPGWKSATIDLGSLLLVSRVDVWFHDPTNVPTTWKVEVSADGSTYTEVFSTVSVRCRTETGPLNGAHWAYPACKHSAAFSPAAARYMRYSFDDNTLIDGLHGWEMEIEVFSP